jgi:hypothetical protein
MGQVAMILVRGVEQSAYIGAERLGDFDNDLDRGIARSALDAAQIDAVDPNHFGKRVLRVICRSAQASHISAKVSNSAHAPYGRQNRASSDILKGYIM